MSDFVARARIKSESRKRAITLSFGEPVTNVCAGVGNKWRHVFFVRCKGDTVEVTDKNGDFADFGCEVIYAGHLTVGEAAKLFQPFWQAQFGRPVAKATGDV